MRWLHDAVCVIILFPRLILAGTHSEPASPKLLWLFLLVGGFSYALCAIHTPVLHFGHVLAEMNPEQSYKLPMLPLFALACGAAVAADLMYDQPVRRITAERLSERQRRRAVAPQDDAMPKE